MKGRQIDADALTSREGIDEDAGAQHAS